MQQCNAFSPTFSLVIVHKLFRCLFLLFLWQTDYCSVYGHGSDWLTALHWCQWSVRPKLMFFSIVFIVLTLMRSCVSRLQVRPRHSSALGLALVTGSGKNTVPTGCTGFLLSQPQGAFISRWRASLDWRGGITASTTVWFLSTPDRSANPAQHHRRLIISCDCGTCMEQSSYQHHSINLFAIFQETT